MLLAIVLLSKLFTAADAQPALEETTDKYTFEVPEQCGVEEVSFCDLTTNVTGVGL